MIRVRHWGRAEYRETWQAMRDFTVRRDAATSDELWVVEHAPVFTLGQAGRHEHLHAPGSIPVVASDRGGQVTYHGPGQVVVYTLVDLRRARLFVREFVYRIEQAVIETLAPLGVAGERVPGAPGIYVRRPALYAPAADDRFAGRAKLAALGIKVQRGAAYHGVALNVAMDLAPFSLIDPCGHRGLRAVDLATLGVQVEWQAVAARLVERLQRQLASGPVPSEEFPQAAAARPGSVQDVPQLR